MRLSTRSNHDLQSPHLALCKGIILPTKDGVDPANPQKCKGIDNDNGEYTEYVLSDITLRGCSDASTWRSLQQQTL
jgi:hypothetical protein